MRTTKAPVTWKMSCRPHWVYVRDRRLLDSWFWIPAGSTGALSTAGRAFKLLLGHFKPDMANICSKHCGSRRQEDVHQLSVINHWRMDQNQRLRRRANMSRYKISFNLECQHHKNLFTSVMWSCRLGKSEPHPPSPITHPPSLIVLNHLEHLNTQS